MRGGRGSVSVEAHADCGNAISLVVSTELPERVAIDDGVAWQKVDGVVVMLALGSAHYYSLDETATRMWDLLDECADVASALAQLQAEYDVDPETLQRDLRGLIARLADAGVLRVEPAPA